MEWIISKARKSWEMHLINVLDTREIVNGINSREIKYLFSQLNQKSKPVNTLRRVKP